MPFLTASCIGCVAGTVCAASSPPLQGIPREIRELTAQTDAGSPAIVPRDELVAALPYDGTSGNYAKGQDFESAFDIYDIFIIEDIVLLEDASLREFRSQAFDTVSGFGLEDFVVRVFEDNGTGLPGEDGYTGDLVVTSVPGAGYFTGSEYVTTFGGHCVPSGSYLFVWAVRMDFTCCGQVFFRFQAGEPTVGGGQGDLSWHWMPSGVLGWVHRRLRDASLGDQFSGVNYLLYGEPSSCSCFNPDCPGDVDFDGDADSDDFFAYLDLFAAGDPCADVDQDGDADSDDFFAYLDLFTQGC